MKAWLIDGSGTTQSDLCRIVLVVRGLGLVSDGNAHSLYKVKLIYLFQDPNTDALGLVEYLFWCQDMSLTPILAVWDGLTIGGGTVSGDDLEPYVADALNELEVSELYLSG